MEYIASEASRGLLQNESKDAFSRLILQRGVSWCFGWLDALD